MSAPAPQRILIASTAKTGNTWLRQLLAAIYDLPTTKLDFPFDPSIASRQGQRWISHQHYWPEPELLRWAQATQATLITTIRHPADVLLSLYHYIRAYRRRHNFYQLADLALDDGSFGEPVRRVIQSTFKDVVGVSAAWVRSGASHIVPYEALYNDPVCTLKHLTDRIQPVPLEAIERAVERCDIGTMRALSQDGSIFFRRGGYGEWRSALPAQIVQLLREEQPYPVFFAELGYSLGEDDVWRDIRPKATPRRAAFFERHGLPPAVVSLMKEIYLSVEASQAERRWPGLAQAACLSSFIAWMHAPAPDDGTAEPPMPPISNWVAHIYRSRGDLQAAFPDPRGRDRISLAMWLCGYTSSPPHFDELLTAPTRRALQAWGTHSDPADIGAPPITSLARFLHRTRGDLRRAYPDIDGEHRIDVLLWVAQHAQAEYGLDAAFTTPTWQALLTWAAQPAAEDPATSASLPPITAVAAHIYRRRPDVRQTLPQLYAGSRIPFLLWLLGQASTEYAAWAELLAPQRSATLAWAMAHAPDQRAQRWAVCTLRILDGGRPRSAMAAGALRAMARMAARW